MLTLKLFLDYRRASKFANIGWIFERGKGLKVNRARTSHCNLIDTRLDAGFWTQPFEQIFADCPPRRTGYFFNRITPTPIPLRSRSGYFSRAFSACSFVLNGLDNGVNSRPTYSKSNYCSTILDISNQLPITF